MVIGLSDHRQAKGDGPVAAQAARRQKFVGLVVGVGRRCTHLLHDIVKVEGGRCLSRHLHFDRYLCPLQLGVQRFHVGLITI